MIYLTAQPDQFYFLWQLQLQLFNFSKIGIKPENIHVLLGYNSKKGLSKEFENFINQNKQASFFIYPDERKRKNYLSSLRPHIIAQHFREYLGLEKENIFYHDSDIVFSALPDFDLLNKDDTWYASDTRSYLDCNYIKQTAGENIFHEMCKAVGIEQSVAENNNSNAGGAQYLLKQCKTSFWDKMENDCENLFQLLENYNEQVGFCNKKNNPNGIQAWCADMWALWWNALLAGKNFSIHSELNFCWADSRVAEWQATKILHYTGSVTKENTTIFRKINYIHYPPFFDNLHTIGRETCSYELAQIIQSYNKEQYKTRINLKDVSFLVLIRIDSPDRLENLYAITSYLAKWFATNIILLEADIESKIDKSLLPFEVEYHFIKDESPILYLTKYKNSLLSKTITPFISMYDVDAVLPVNQITKAIDVLRKGTYAIVSPYSGNFVSVDRLLKAMFTKLCDPEIFETNKNKFCTGTTRSFGGAVFINREIYLQAGMENLNLTGWGPDDIERVKRMEILGYPVKRIPGNLYHLPHERGRNSSYQNGKEHDIHICEYLNICSMRRPELENYIKTWNKNADKTETIELTC